MTDSSGDRRVFTGSRKVRLGDVTVAGRLRLDALTRYTQDVSDDDTTDAGLAADPGWVVRRTVVRQRTPAVFGETIEISTSCSGLGRRWAERELQVVGDEGARYEVVTLWICVDPVTGRPAALTDQFLGIYGASAGGRSVTARLTNPKLPDNEPDLDRWPWPLRVADFDTLGHVNNAAYWTVVEELMAAAWAPVGSAFDATMEYSAGLGSNDDVTIVTASSGGRCQAWWSTATDTVAASVFVNAAASPPVD
ncbi:MAG: acyl-ACP thioesterase domain-containing protein [Acidimicrobiales bacterium]